MINRWADCDCRKESSSSKDFNELDEIIAQVRIFCFVEEGALASNEAKHIAIDGGGWRGFIFFVVLEWDAAFPVGIIEVICKTSDFAVNLAYLLSDSGRIGIVVLISNPVHLVNTRKLLLFAVVSSVFSGVGLGNTLTEYLDLLVVLERLGRCDEGFVGDG